MRYLNPAGRLSDGTLKHQAAFTPISAPAPLQAVAQAAMVSRSLQFWDSDGTQLQLGPPLPPGVQVSRRSALDHHLLRTIHNHIISLVAAVPFGLDEADRTPTAAGQRALMLVEQMGPLTRGAMGADLRMLGQAMAIKYRGGLEAGYLNDPVGGMREIERLIYVSPLDVTTHVVDTGAGLQLQGYTVGGNTYAAGRSTGGGLAPGGVSETPLTGRGRGEYLPQDFVHIKGIPDPRYLGFYGLDLTPAALRLVQTDIEQTDYTQTTIHNAGTGPVITAANDEVDVEDVRRYRDEIVRDVTGAQRGKPAVVPYGLNLNPVGLSPRDMLLDSLYKLPEARLAALYGLSATMIGWLVGLENSPWSHLEQAREAEAEEVTTAVCKALEIGLTAAVMLEYSPVDAFRFDVDSIRALQEDVNKQAERLVSLVDAMIITEEQAAQELGYDYQVERNATFGGAEMPERDDQQDDQAMERSAPVEDNIWWRAAEMLFGPAAGTESGTEGGPAAGTESGGGAAHPGFRATIARRDVVDKAGVLAQPEAFRAQDGEGVYLFRQHPQLRNAERVSLGAGVLRVTRDEAWVEGELNDTERAREFVREFDTARKYGLGESSVGMRPISRAAVRTGNQLNAHERALGAKAVVDQARAFEVSFVDYGMMPNSTFDLVRSLDALDDGMLDEPSAAPTLTLEEEAALASFREYADTLSV